MRWSLERVIASCARVPTFFLAGAVLCFLYWFELRPYGQWIVPGNVGSSLARLFGHDVWMVARDAPWLPVSSPTQNKSESPSRRAPLGARGWFLFLNRVG